MRPNRTLRLVKLALGLALALLCRRAHAAGSGGPFDLDEANQVLAPLVFQQLALLPIARKPGRTVDTTRYLTLDEGLRSGKVKVSERGPGGDVNHVQVENHADRPLFLLGGKVILGGQQDRILGKDTVLAPGEVATLDVFCVEHGRWRGARGFTATGGMASSKIRAKAKYAADQGAVWAEVAEKQRTLGGANATGTYRTLSTGEAGQKAAQPYRDHFLAALDRLPEAKRLVGFVAAVNGRVTAVEIFDSPALFAAERAALLDGVFLSAADQPLSAPASALAPAEASVKEFVREAEGAREEAAFDSRAARTVLKKGGKVQNATVKDASKPAAPPVYRSYQVVE